MNRKTNFSPIKKSKRAFEEVALNIKESIFNGVWEAGERLPSETELSNQFHVSRHTIREALRTLELSGFLIIKTGVSGGPIVKNTIKSTIGSLYLDAFQMEKISLEQLTTARVGIEKAILDVVMDIIEESDIKSLQENILRAWDRAENGLPCIEENIEFHRLLANASKNPIFVIVIESIIAVIHGFHSRQPPDPDTCEEAVKYHEDILNAIIEKDRSKALKLLENHFVEVKDGLQSLVEQNRDNKA